MATTVFDIVEIELLDGSELTLRPLKIRLLREFMKRFQSIADAPAEDNDASLDLILDCVQIAMKQYNEKLANDREALEDVIDLPTAYKVIEVASGIKLNDPNLVAAGLAGMS